MSKARKPKNADAAMDVDTEGRHAPTDPAPPLDAEPNPQANARAARMAHVQSVLVFVRAELPDFMRRNPSYDLTASVPALQRQYESEHSELMRAEEAIADAGARDA